MIDPDRRNAIYQLHLANCADKDQPPGDVWALPELDPLNKQPLTKGDPRVYPYAFSLDPETGLVHFSDYVYQNASAGDHSGNLVPIPATLRLRCAVSVRNSKTGGAVRYRKSQATGGTFGTKTRWMHHDEITLGMYPQYAPGSYDVQAMQSNQATQVDPFCQQFLDAACKEYQVQTPQNVRYIGLRNIAPDGAIQHLTWQVDRSGAFTVASRNTEQLVRTISYQERRRLEQLKQQAAIVARAKRQFGPLGA